MLRVLDSGLRPPRANLSLTEALRRGHAAGTSPATLRFQHFPPSAIIGRHQLLAREIDLPWCAANGIALARRMTGGGAIVMGPGLLGWELVLHRRHLPATLDAITALLCTAVATALSGFGIDAKFRPRNDIEVAGRKLCGTGGYVEGDTLVFQGTVLRELDLALLDGALRLPTRKLGRHGLAALADRVTDLRALLGSAPSTADIIDAMAGALGGALRLQPTAGTLTAAEEAAAQRIHDAELGTDAFVHGADDTPPTPGRTIAHQADTDGGAITIILKLRDGAAGIIDQAIIAGDFFATPPDAIARLEAALRGQHAAALPTIAEQALAGTAFLGLAPTAMLEAIAAAARDAIA